MIQLFRSEKGIKRSETQSKMKGVNEYTKRLRLLRYNFKSWYFYKERKYEKLTRVKNKGIWRGIAAWFPCFTKTPFPEGPGTSSMILLFFFCCCFFLHQMFWLAFNNIFLEKNGVVYSQLDGEELRVCPRKAIKTISFKMRNTFKDLFKTIFWTTRRRIDVYFDTDITFKGWFCHKNCLTTAL